MDTGDRRRPVVEIRGISKAFDSVQALDRVGLELYSGEVLALIGDNGAGKSTLVKVISGVEQPDEGEIRIDGSVVRFNGPGMAQQHGIATVYQDLALVDDQSVGTNIYLGREPRRWRWFVDFASMNAGARRTLDVLRIDIPVVTAHVRHLSGGQRQAIAIARTLVRDSRVVLLDEPAAALGVTQTEKVTTLIHDLRTAGKAVVLISHNLQHVFEVADRLAVMRLGKNAGVRMKSQTSPEEVIGLITGASADNTPSEAVAAIG